MEPTSRPSWLLATFWGGSRASQTVRGSKEHKLCYKRNCCIHWGSDCMDQSQLQEELGHRRCVRTKQTRSRTKWMMTLIWGLRGGPSRAGRGLRTCKSSHTEQKWLFAFTKARLYLPTFFNPKQWLFCRCLCWNPEIILFSLNDRLLFAESRWEKSLFHCFSTFSHWFANRKSQLVQENYLFDKNKQLLSLANLTLFKQAVFLTKLYLWVWNNLSDVQL